MIFLTQAGAFSIAKGGPFSIAIDTNEESNAQDQLNTIADGHFMFLDDVTLSNLAKRAGFKVLECRFNPLSYKSESWELDGRETVILIAEKP